MAGTPTSGGLLGLVPDIGGKSLRERYGVGTLAIVGLLLFVVSLISFLVVVRVIAQTLREVEREVSWE